MTDRELLELAAKAAGYWDAEFNCYKGAANWNPLDDDGDALRLAVNLRLIVDINDEEGEVKVRKPWYPSSEVFEPLFGDPYAATCRAIVRAAAEIGRGME